MKAEDIRVVEINTTAFEEENFVFYIGHTRTTFSNRMRGYRLGNGHNTNYRIHSYIREQLQVGKHIKVYVLNNIYNCLHLLLYQILNTCTIS